MVEQLRKEKGTEKKKGPFPTYSKSFLRIYARVGTAVLPLRDALRVPLQDHYVHIILYLRINTPVMLLAAAVRSFYTKITQEKERKTL